MADQDSVEPKEQNEEVEEGEQPEPENSFADLSSSESDYDSDSSSDGDYEVYTQQEEEQEDDNSPETNIKQFTRVLDGRRMRKRLEEEEKEYVFHEDLFDFPKDKENWREEDLREYWADAPLEMTKPGWDPVWADEDDWEVVIDEIRAGRDPPIAPFYVPYRKYYPAIPDNHYDISNPKAVIEELDRIEEFLQWVSYIFPDGSSYEGTVWDDLAHGKGVYVAEQGLVRYEGEWLRNDMEGHGVVEVEIPGREPVPGSKLEAKMRAEGKIISRDFMSPDDRAWLEMDIEDSIRLAGGNYEIPFDENNEWIGQFGSKPEKGRYRYAGQWKHGRMHGCGVYEVNERPIHGRFYFGELAEDSTGCDENVSALHAGIAEVAAAKARMFVNKPDGMIREQRGPYSDPQHPYLYEEEDAWMAPGFINQFYEVPDYWKMYANEVDQEREMWLNSFYRAPLRIPMPAELEYWWSKGDESPEFILVNKEPEPDPDDPSKLVYTEEPLILHTRTGRLINYIDDEKYGIRLFWQPPLKDGEEVDPEKAKFLPLGFDEFYGQAVPKEKQNIWKRLITAVENTCKPLLEKLEKWAEEKKKASEMKLKLLEQEMEFIEAELCLEEVMEDMETELKKEEEEEKKVSIDQQDEDDTSASAPANQAGTDSVEEEEEEEDEDDEAAPSSFGSVITDQDKNSKKGNKPGNSPFSSSSMSFASCSIGLTVPSKLHQSFLSWKNQRSPMTTNLRPCSGTENSADPLKMFMSVSFPRGLSQSRCLKAVRPENRRFRKRNDRLSQLHSLSGNLSGHQPCTKLKRSLEKHNRICSHQWLQTPPLTDVHSILSMHIPLCSLEDTKAL